MLLITKGNTGYFDWGDYLFFRDAKGLLQKDGLYTTHLDGRLYPITIRDGQLTKLSSIKKYPLLNSHSITRDKELNSKAQIDMNSLTDNDIQLIFNSFKIVAEET